MEAQEESMGDVVAKAGLGLAVVELPEAEGVAVMRRIVGMFVDVDVGGVEVVVAVGRDKVDIAVRISYGRIVVEKKKKNLKVFVNRERKNNKS
jgi:proteasome assembly chaperone (PAC2) family protein